MPRRNNINRKKIIMLQLLMKDLLGNSEKR